MTNSISIRPSKDLRTNYSQISELSKINPVAITVNGREDTVIMSHSEYVKQINYISELETKLELYRELAIGLEDVNLGNIQKSDDAFSEIYKDLDNLDI